MKDNKKINLDNVFAQLREESKPTPLRHLVEPRASGALFALKQSVSLPLSSAKMLWIGIGCACVLGAAGGVLYKTNSAEEHKHPHTEAVAHSVRYDTLPDATDNHTIVEQAEEQQATGTAAEIVEAGALATAPDATAHREPAQRTDRIEKISRANGGQSVSTHTSRAAHTMASKISNRDESSEAQPNVDAASNFDNNELDITAAQYADDAGELSMAMNNALQPIEEFPLEQPVYSRYQDYVSLMLNSFALPADIVEVQSEIRLGDNMSCGLVLGVGNVAGAKADTSHFLMLAGAQFNYYLLGDFQEGLQIGAQATFTNTDANAKNSFLYEHGRVLSLVPYAGYKFIMASGLTMNLQAGVGAATPVFAPAAAGTDRTALYKWHISTRVHLNIGWSL